jgi:hypothetical protein
VALPFRLLTRRAGPIGLALTAYDIWRRIPPAQRRQLLAATRKHGPRLAANAVERGRKLRAVRRGKRP